MIRQLRAFGNETPAVSRTRAAGEPHHEACHPIVNRIGARSARRRPSSRLRTRHGDGQVGQILDAQRRIIRRRQSDAVREACEHVLRLAADDCTDPAELSLAPVTTGVPTPPTADSHMMRPRPRAEWGAPTTACSQDRLSRFLVRASHVRDHRPIQLSRPVLHGQKPSLLGTAEPSFWRSHEGLNLRSGRPDSDRKLNHVGVRRRPVIVHGRHNAVGERPQRVRDP